MIHVLCPPCGSVFEGATEDDVVRIAQEHAKAKHAYDLPREEILQAMTTNETPAKAVRD